MLDGDRAALRDVGLAAGRKGFLLAALFAGGRSRRVHDLKPCPRSPSRAWFNGRSIDSHQVISGNGKALVSKAFATVAESSGFCNPQKTVTPTNDGPSVAQTLCKEWAYALPFENYQEQNARLPPYLAIDIHLSVLSTRSSRSHQQELRWPVC